jgi:serine/threonine protein kinase
MLGRKLGEGKFGDVYLCKHKATQMIYAIKIILKS